MNFRKLTLAAASVASLTLSGCSVFTVGEEPPECAVNTGGVDCVSARQVWAATDTYSNLEGLTADEVRREAAKNDPGSDKSNTATGTGIAAMNLGGGAVTPPPSAEERAEAYGRFQEERLHLPSPDPLAVRETPKILRITVAPYTNENDHLVMPSQLFAEVEQRTWTIGTQATKHTNRITPTNIRSQSASTSQLSSDTPRDAGGMGIDVRQQPKEFDFEGIIPNVNQPK